MVYDVEFRPKAAKDLNRLSPDVARRILDKIAVLRHDLSGDVKQLVHFTNEYRLRVGDYRVLFDLDGQRIIIYRIRHRSEAYDS
jgi:mRNA interferase RelE/StbE